MKELSDSGTQEDPCALCFKKAHDSNSLQEDKIPAAIMKMSFLQCNTLRGDLDQFADC